MDEEDTPQPGLVRPERPALKGRSSRDRPRRRSKQQKIVINVSNCKYEAVRIVADRLNWILDEEMDEFDSVEARSADPEDREPWNVYWTDNSVSPQRAMRLKEYQRINHFPGMFNLARKGGLGKHLTRLAKLFPLDFNFFPQTWVLPAQWSDFKEQIDSGKGNRTFIIKPDASCQGRGIFLTRNYDNINPTENLVAQRYLHKPLLIDDVKFDMRIYVVVTNVSPLRMFLFEDGLVRLCTEKYVEPKGTNLSQTCVHLTNYAINKTSGNFVYNSNADDNGIGHKRSLTWFWKWMKDTHGEGPVASLKSDINDMLIKALISVQPLLAHTYKTCVPQSKKNADSVNTGSRPSSGSKSNEEQSAATYPATVSNCFEILGFDVLVDRKFKPWLIEVNHSPSFAIDTPLDKTIKTKLIEKTLKLINVTGNDKKKAKMQAKKNAQSRLYNKPAEVIDACTSSTNLKQNTDSCSLELESQMRNEIALADEGTFLRIYPPESLELFNYYQPYFCASESLFTETSDGVRRQSSLRQRKPTSPRSKLREKAALLKSESDEVRGRSEMALGDSPTPEPKNPSGSNNNSESNSINNTPEPTRIVRRQSSCEDKRVALLPPTCERGGSGKRNQPMTFKVGQKKSGSGVIRFDLEVFKARGMKRRSTFDTYLKRDTISGQI